LLSFEIFNQQVAGSSPIASFIFFKGLCRVRVSEILKTTYKPPLRADLNLTRKAKFIQQIISPFSTAKTIHLLI